MSADSTNGSGTQNRPMPMLRRLQLKNFRSVPSADIEWDNPTFLVGRNGSGKSNIVDAFAFLADAMSGPLQAVLDRRGGITAVRNRSSAKSRPPNWGLGVVLTDLNGEVKEARYAMEIKALKNYGFEVVREQCVVNRDSGDDWFDRGPGGKFESSEAGLKPAVEPNALVLPLIGGDSRFQPVHRFLSEMRTYCIEPPVLRGMQDPDGGGRFLLSDGSNAASVLREIQKRSDANWQSLLDLLEYIAPKTISVRPKQHGNKLALEFTQNWGKLGKVNFQAYNMSDGTLRAVGILAAVFQKPAPSVLVIEEPESTIHPDGLAAILDLLRHAGRFMQVVVTTHSPDILDAKWVEDHHLRIVIWDEGKTCVSLVSEPTRQALQERLAGAGKLLRSNALTAEAEDDPFVQNPDQPRLFQNDLG